MTAPAEIEEAALPPGQAYDPDRTMRYEITLLRRIDRAFKDSRTCKRRDGALLDCAPAGGA